MEVNFWGTVNPCRVFLPILLQRPEANLTNMSKSGGAGALRQPDVLWRQARCGQTVQRGTVCRAVRHQRPCGDLFPGNVSTNLTGELRGRDMIRADAGADQDPRVRPARRSSRASPGQLRVLVGTDARLLLDLFARGIGQADDQIPSRSNRFCRPVARQANWNPDRASSGSRPDRRGRGRRRVEGADEGGVAAARWARRGRCPSCGRRRPTCRWPCRWWVVAASMFFLSSSRSAEHLRRPVTRNRNSSV